MLGYFDVWCWDKEYRPRVMGSSGVCICHKRSAPTGIDHDSGEEGVRGFRGG